MINLTEEEYGMLKATPAWDKFINQMAVEVQQQSLDIADGILLTNNAEETALAYAKHVGRLSTLIDIVNFRPSREESEDLDKDGEALEKEMM